MGTNLIIFSSCMTWKLLHHASIDLCCQQSHSGFYFDTFGCFLWEEVDIQPGLLWTDDRHLEQRVQLAQSGAPVCFSTVLLDEGRFNPSCEEQSSGPPGYHGYNTLTAEAASIIFLMCKSDSSLSIATQNAVGLSCSRVWQSRYSSRLHSYVHLA